MHQQFGVIYEKQKSKFIESNMVITRSKALAPQPACRAEQRGTLILTLATADNCHMINQLTRVIQEMQEVLQEPDERNRQTQEKFACLRAQTPQATDDHPSAPHMDIFWAHLANYKQNQTSSNCFWFQESIRHMDTFPSPNKSKQLQSQKGLLFCTSNFMRV